MGCSFRFSDPDFPEVARDTVYYVRAVEETTPAVNAGNLRCSYDSAGRCVKMDPCVGVPASDDCLAPNEERAWSSPIFVDYESP